MCVSTKLPKRLFDLVDALQGSRRHTTASLAAQLGVSQRTVRRDLARLQDLDLPVNSRPGRNGGVELPSGALLPSLRFTDDELLSLVVSLQHAETAEEPQLRQAATRALERLETVLSPTTKGRLRALQRALSPGRPEGRPVPAPSEHVFALAEAIDQQRRIEISYRSPGDAAADDTSATRPTITRRQVDPYGLARLGPWYLVAYCHLREDLRTFRVDRIRSVALTGATFVRPEGFDAYRRVAESIAMAPGQGSVVCRALLGTDIQTASRLVPLATVVLEPVASGVRLSVRIHANDVHWFVSQLLRLSCPVSIEGPPELQAAAELLANRAAKLVACQHPSAA